MTLSKYLLLIIFGAALAGFVVLFESTNDGRVDLEAPIGLVPPSKCLPFDSALVIGMRGSGLKTLLENVAYPLYGTQSQGRTALLQGGTATAERLNRLFIKSRSGGNASVSSEARTVVMTALRNPLDRIVNRYWFEGRWPQHSKKTGRRICGADGRMDQKCSTSECCGQPKP